MGGLTDRYAEHDRAKRALLSAYEALPPGAPVKLAKKTSNLFRFSNGAAPKSPGLDVQAFSEVLSVDPVARTADVQGMVTYEKLVEATLAHGLMPFVVPQLKTITLGGAVAGLGIESTSFRNGLPHESVLEMEIMTGDGRIVTATGDNEHADLFRAFPNSYGTLGYSLRLKIELEPVQPYVELRHLKFDEAEACWAAMAEICAAGEHDGRPVDFIDGTVFGPDEMYLTLARFTDTLPDGTGAVSDYTGMSVYYKSLRERSVDHLTVHDYIWRWDTDWFWCSRAFGVQNPRIRRLWPQRYRRSDVYRKIVAFDRRHQLTARLARWRRQPAQEAVIQDVEVPVAAGPKFMDFFHREIGIEPVWLCPLRLRSGQAWPLYPLEPGELYVNVGFWSTVDLEPGQPDGHHNRLIEEAVTAAGGHKSLYSTVHYDQDEFWRLYNGDKYAAVKAAYDGDRRLPDLYEKCVRMG
ncbi:FAD-binding oxidoreductase [Hamadaea sp. NPDC050747]|uniref:FAD-binding oxidoreductase n=1 Tax=Hamadaea sp. NPDC050747 TaxID=3155789 RepID=UPI00340C4318